MEAFRRVIAPSRLRFFHRFIDRPRDRQKYSGEAGQTRLKAKTGRSPPQSRDCWWMSPSAGWRMRKVLAGLARAGSKPLRPAIRVSAAPREIHSSSWRYSGLRAPL
jgi:hypothetical protein